MKFGRSIRGSRSRSRWALLMIAAVVLAAIVGSDVGIARADVIEEDDPVVAFEVRGDEFPCRLAAAEPMCEQHDLSIRITADAHVVPSQGVQHSGRCHPYS